MAKNLFITFEGGEGGGKTTQINRLAQSLTDKKFRVLTTREPGGTPEAEKIRDFLVQRDGGDWNPMAECLLLFAARAMHVEQIIRPALGDGKIVISDRFTDSTRAYQGYGRGFSLETIEQINALVLGDFEPDLTILLDVDSKIGIGRSQRRITAESLHFKQTEDRFEYMEDAFHQRVNAGFLDLARQNPGRFHIIDSAKTIEDIEHEILTLILGRLNQAT